jgi:hypothetical protein
LQIGGERGKNINFSVRIIVCPYSPPIRNNISCNNLSEKICLSKVVYCLMLNHTRKKKKKNVTTVLLLLHRADTCRESDNCVKGYKELQTELDDATSELSRVALRNVDATRNKSITDGKIRKLQFQIQHPDEDIIEGAPHFYPALP